MFWLADDTIAKSLIWTWEVVRMVLCCKLCHELLILDDKVSNDITVCWILAGPKRILIIVEDMHDVMAYNLTRRGLKWRVNVLLSAANKFVVCRPAIDGWSRLVMEIDDQKTGHDLNKVRCWTCLHHTTCFRYTTSYLRAKTSTTTRTVRVRGRRSRCWCRPFSWRGGFPDPKDRETQAASRCLESRVKCVAGCHLGADM